jgi:murein DD-endopeptidase MepM/ murein hydrolase activator NlpD
MSVRVSLGLLLLLCAGGCAGSGSLLTRLGASPHEQYTRALARAGLESSVVARQWIEANRRALAAPFDLTLPFREDGYFPPSEPSAAAYRLSLAQGRVLVVEVRFDSAEPGRLFVDLFRSSDDGADLARVASLADAETQLRYEVARDGVYLLRLQPELLRGGRYTIEQRTEASLRLFPVAGLTAAAVQSGFGAPRGATREHEGIDIFAPRGTPVVAVVDGIAAPGSNALGGTVVWLQDTAARRRFYYAHLDRTALPGSTRVAAGAVIGFVGNSGNARTTAPHLHFGLYSAGALDPLPYLAADDGRAPEPTATPADWGVLYRVATRGGSRGRETPRLSGTSRLLPQGTSLTVEAVSAAAWRVRLPDETRVYVPASSVTPARPALRRVVTTSRAPLRERPNPTAVTITELPPGESLDVVGVFETSTLVRREDGLTGWLGSGLAR